MTHLAFPFSYDSRGRTGESLTQADYIKAMVEQTLLTSPGERVNRPEFGAGLLDMVFEPGSETLSEAAGFLVRSSLQRWLQDMLIIEALTVRIEEGSLVLDLTYVVLASQERLSQTVERAL